METPAQSTSPARAQYEKRVRLIGACIVGVMYLAHTWVHLTEDDPIHMLWFCNVSLLFVLVGFALRSRSFMGIGFVWSLFGTPLWLFDLLSGGDLLWTSFVTHFGGIAISAWGLKVFGVPRGLWWKVIAAFVPLHVLSHFVTPPELNINISHRIWDGFEEIIPWYPVYISFFYIGGMLLGGVIEVVGRKIVGEVESVPADPG